MGHEHYVQPWSIGSSPPRDMEVLIDMRLVPGTDVLPDVATLSRHLLAHYFHVRAWLDLLPDGHHYSSMSSSSSKASSSSLKVCVLFWERLWKRAPTVADALLFLANDPQDAFQLRTISAYPWAIFRQHSPQCRQHHEPTEEQPGTEFNASLVALVSPVLGSDAEGLRSFQGRLFTHHPTISPLTSATYKLWMPLVTAGMSNCPQGDWSTVHLRTIERYLLYAVHIGMLMPSKYDPCIFGVTSKRMARPTRPKKLIDGRRRMRLVSWERAVAILAFIAPRPLVTVQETFDVALGLQRRHLLVSVPPGTNPRLLIGGRRTNSFHRTNSGMIAWRHVLSEPAILQLAAVDKFDLAAHIYSP
jgi:hypothetical protein